MKRQTGGYQAGVNDCGPSGPGRRGAKPALAEGTGEERGRPGKDRVPAPRQIRSGFRRWLAALNHAPPAFAGDLAEAGHRDEADGEAPQHDHVLRTVAGADAAAVLVEAPIEEVVLRRHLFGGPNKTSKHRSVLDAGLTALYDPATVYPSFGSNPSVRAAPSGLARNCTAHVPERPEIRRGTRGTPVPQRKPGRRAGRVSTATLPPIHIEGVNA